MPARSVKQQRLMGMVRAHQKGELKNPSRAVTDLADRMNSDDVSDFARTKHEGLPMKKKQEKKASVAEITNMVTNYLLLKEANLLPKRAIDIGGMSNSVGGKSGGGGQLGNLGQGGLEGGRGGGGNIRPAAVKRPVGMGNASASRGVLASTRPRRASSTGGVGTRLETDKE